MADRTPSVAVRVRTAVVHDWVARDGRHWGLALVTYQVDLQRPNTMAVLVNEDDLE